MGIDIIKRIECDQKMALGVYTEIALQAMYRFKESEAITLTLFAYVTNKTSEMLQVVSIPLSTKT